MALCSSLLGCATGQKAPPTRESIAASIAQLGEEELWVCGQAAFQAEDFLRSAMCFSLLADEFPKSPKRRQALTGAGRAWERLEEWEDALLRYKEAYDPLADDAVPLTWKITTSLYELDRYEEALLLLEPLADDDDLSVTDRIRARVWAGVCKLEMGDWQEAEMDFRKALFTLRREEGKERVDPYFPAQAQFFIGEVYRLRFESITIDQTDDVEQLGETIEEKSRLLLSAQGHYVRAVRLGHPHWATAAGQRIGALYERFYDEMLEAPIPSMLTPSQAELYREELKEKVRVLIRKAIAAYERTLAAAERIGLDTAFVEETRKSLLRMERLLLEDEQRDRAADAPSPHEVTSAGNPSRGGPAEE